MVWNIFYFSEGLKPPTSCGITSHPVAPTGGLPRWQPQQSGGTAERALRSALRGGAVDAVRGRPGVLGDPAWLGGTGRVLEDVGRVSICRHLLYNSNVFDSV